MYLPPYFHERDIETLRQFLHQYSFALLTSQSGSEPFATHLPLLFDEFPAPHGSLLGHVARNNPHWQMAEGQTVLAIFQGPHAYISPSWYQAPQVVPTWNYVAVHVYGTLRCIQDERETWDLLRRTVEKYESARRQPWSIDSLEIDWATQLARGIVGLRIEVERMEGKWKLNQNHSAARRLRVIDELRRSGTHDEMKLAELMERRSSQNRPRLDGVLNEAIFDLDDQEFLQAFEACRIPKSWWTHTAHVRMAWLYLRQRPFTDALTRIRTGIKKFNAAAGTSTGYHETMTTAFTLLISCASQAHSNWEDFCRSHPELLTNRPSELEKYYLPTTLQSERAAGEVVRPDRNELPLPVSVSWCDMQISAVTESGR